MKTNRIFFVLSFFLLAILSPHIVSGKFIYVDDDAAGLNDGSSWENAYVLLHDALSYANSSEKPIEVRVAQGIYTPDQGIEQSQYDMFSTFVLENGVILSGGYA